MLSHLLFLTATAHRLFPLFICPKGRIPIQVLHQDMPSPGMFLASHADTVHPASERVSFIAGFHRIRFYPGSLLTGFDKAFCKVPIGRQLLHRPILWESGKEHLCGRKGDAPIVDEHALRRKHVDEVDPGRHVICDLCLDTCVFLFIHNQTAFFELSDQPGICLFIGNLDVCVPKNRVVSDPVVEGRCSGVFSKKPGALLKKPHKSGPVCNGCK